MKVLVLGAGGMAGHVVSLYLKEHQFTVDTLSARNRVDGHTHLVDVTDRARLDAFLAGSDYDVVVNCIGVLIKQSEERPDLAVYLNSYLPRHLEARYIDSATRVIHISTDCVFSGKNAPYREDSVYDGELFYDRSKALGEIVNDKDLTFRMSIVGPDMHPEGVGLFNWFCAQTGEISGYTQAIWSGITTIELAKGIEAAISGGLTGLYHLVPSSGISKFDLLQLFKDVFRRADVAVLPSDGVRSDKTLVNSRTDFDHRVPDYKTMVEEMRSWITAHASLYEHYR